MNCGRKKLSQFHRMIHIITSDTCHKRSRSGVYAMWKVLIDEIQYSSLRNTHTLYPAASHSMQNYGFRKKEVKVGEGK
jgi:hypothetical protein